MWHSFITESISKMDFLIFDLETNGLLADVSTIHSLVIKNVTTKEVISCADHEDYVPIDTGIDILMKADGLIGHNIIKYDLPVLRKLYSHFKTSKNCIILDTLVMSRLWAPELDSLDYSRWLHIEPKYKGRHSLAAWGERLGVKKINFKEEAKKDVEVADVWDKWSKSMQVYCEQDVTVSESLYKYFIAQKMDKRSLNLEHEFAIVMSYQEAFGFPFNKRAAFALVNELKAKQSDIGEQLQDTFPPVSEERWSEKTGKQLKTKVITFNPASRLQTSQRLREKYPEITFETTEKGSPKVDDDVLEKLGTKYPEAKLLAEYQLLNKRIGQLSDGKEAWLKHCEKFGDGKIHGEIITNACISGRCSHKRPNTGQIPSVGHAYGAECRSLFYAPDGWLLGGADASGLELRALGHWLAYYDDGEYAELVSDPDRDIHFHNACLFGIHDKDKEIPKLTRDLSKRLIYCILYGGGAKKTGSIMSPKDSEHKQYERGKETIETFYRNLPAIKKLKDKVEATLNQRDYLMGIDGRRLQIRSKHSALNQLLQSTGAISVKKATTILYNDMTNKGLKFFKDWGFVAHVHDEYQCLLRPPYTELFKELAIDSFRKSGEYFSLKCPLTGEAKIGKNWCETH